MIDQHGSHAKPGHQSRVGLRILVAGAPELYQRMVAQGQDQRKCQARRSDVDPGGETVEGGADVADSEPLQCRVRTTLGGVRRCWHTDNVATLGGAG